MTCFRVFLFLTILAFNLDGYSHEGHEVQDVVLDNLNDLGEVDFLNTCHVSLKNDINIGVALIHHMMYAQAEKHFSKLILQNPDCAILYWGYSMTLFHPLWPDVISEEALRQGHSALIKGLELPADTREKAYLKAAFEYFESWETVSESARLKNWERAHKQLSETYAADLDALTFYGLSQLVMAPKNDRNFRVEQAVGKQLKAIFNMNPKHPGVIHYAIHAYDNPKLAQLGREFAHAYSDIAPNVPHALHMPSHIFVRLGDWLHASEWNIRSANAALELPVNDLTSFHYVHAGDYLVYSYMQSGEKVKAQAYLKEVQKHHPIQPTFPAAYALSAMPARIAMESKDWLGASQLNTRSPEYIDWNKFPQVEAITYFAKGVGAAKAGDLTSAKECLVVLQGLYNKTFEISPEYWAILLKSQSLMVEAWIEFSKNSKITALQLAQKSADLEDSVDKNPVTPGAILPARELFADMLVLFGEFDRAIAEYEMTLVKSPGRKNSLEGLELAKDKLRLSKLNGSK